MKFASVIVDISHEKLDRPFSYIIPKSLEDKIEVEILKHHAKVQALAAQFFIAEFVRVIVVEQNLTAHRNSALLGQLQIVHAAQQGGFAAAAGTDDGKHFAFRPS